MTGKNDRRNEFSLPEHLRLWFCLECRYDLTGHPLTGTCPECGAAYDRDKLAMRARWSGRSEQRSWPEIIAAAVPTVLAVQQYTSYGLGARVLLLLLLACIAPPAVGFIRWIARRTEPDERVLLADESGITLVTKDRVDHCLPWRNVRMIKLHQARPRRTWRGWQLVLRTAPWKTISRPTLFQLQIEDADAETVEQALRRYHQNAKRRDA